MNRSAEQLCCHTLGVGANSALPHANHTPALFLGQARRPFVALRVTSHFLVPEFSVRSNPGLLAAVLGTSVPEAPIDEDSDSAAGQDKVGSTALGQPAVQSKPAPEGMHCPSQRNFRRRVRLAPPGKVSPLSRADPLCAHASKLAGADAPSVLVLPCGSVRSRDALGAGRHLRCSAMAVRCQTRRRGVPPPTAKPWSRVAERTLCCRPSEGAR